MAFAGVFYPLEDLVDVERRWRDYALSAPDEVTTFVVTMTFPAAPGMPEGHCCIGRVLARAGWADVSPSCCCSSTAV